MIQELEKRAEDLDLPDILAYVEYWLEGGKTLKGLAEDVGPAINYPTLSRPMISMYLNGLPDGPTRMTEARAKGAHAHVEDAITIADNAKAQADEIAKANMQVRIRQWYAERTNRAEYGQQVKHDVALTLPQLHLDALRARQPTPLLIPGTPEVHELPQPDDAA